MKSAILYYFLMFQSKREASQHLARHPEKTCSTCNVVFPDKEKYDIHLAKEHPEKLLFKCKDCGKEYKDGNLFQQHRKGHRNEQELKFVCEMCGKVSKTKSTHQVHMRSHDRKKAELKGELNELCTICGKGFASAFYVSQHMKNTHSTAQILCTTCGKTFKTKKHLAQHMNWVHLGKKKYYGKQKKSNLAEASKSSAEVERVTVEKREADLQEETARAAAVLEREQHNQNLQNLAWGFRGMPFPPSHLYQQP